MYCLRTYFALFILGFFTLNLFGSASSALSCMYSYDKSKTEVIWTAFKTEKKVAVNGKLTSFEVTGSTEGRSIADILEKIHFSINSLQSDTGDKIRDMTIKKAFFQGLSNDSLIKGSFSDLKEGQVTMNLTLNGVTKAVLMQVSIVEETKLSLKGTIDVLDFKMEQAHDKLSNACKVKHEGKTWTEVGLELKAEFRRNGPC